MANFSINQVRHLYVANSIGTVNDSSAKGTIELKNTADEKAILKEEFIQEKRL